MLFTITHCLSLTHTPHHHPTHTYHPLHIAQGYHLITISCSALTDSTQLLATLQQACGTPVTTAAGKALRPQV